VTEKRDPLPDADEWKARPDKAPLFSPNPGPGD
jgi:hypothetical protein